MGQLPTWSDRRASRRLKLKPVSVGVAPQHWRSHPPPRQDEPGCRLVRRADHNACVCGRVTITQELDVWLCLAKGAC